MSTVAATAQVRRRRLHRRRPPVAKYVALLIFVVIVLMPVYVLLVTSFKDVTETDVAHAWSLPQVWTVSAWREAR